MATEDVLAWMNRDEWPGDFYELLGRWRFDPDIEAMKTDVAMAMRELHHYQNSASSKAKRAMRLQSEYVGRAEWLFSDPQRLQEENNRILKSLRQEFVGISGNDASRWNQDELLTWLLGDARVDPRVAEEVRVCLVHDRVWTPRKRVSVFGDRASNGSVDFSDDTFFVVPEEDQRALAPEILRAVPPPLPPRKAVKKTISCPMCKAVVPVASAECSNCAYDFTASQVDSRSRSRPRQFEEEELTILPERDGISPVKLTAVIGAVIGLPLLLLIGVLVWMNSGDDGEDSGKPDVADGPNSIKTADPGSSKTGPGKTIAKTIPIAGKKTIVVVKKAKLPPKDPPFVAPPRSKIIPASYIYWKNKGLKAKGKAERDAFLTAFILAPNDEERALVYSYLAYSDLFLKTATFQQLKDGINALSRSSRQFLRIKRLVPAIASRKDFLGLFSTYVDRLKRDSNDTAAARALRMLLDSANSITRFQLTPDTVFAAYALMIRAQSRDSDRLSIAAKLVDYAEKQKITTKMLTHFKDLLKRDAKEAAASAVLRQFVGGGLTKAFRLSGASRTTAIRAVFSHISADFLRTVLLPGLSSTLLRQLTGDSDFLRGCTYELGLAVFEAAASKYLPPNFRSTTSLAIVFGQLSSFVEGRGKLTEAIKRYSDRMKKDPRDLLAREMYNGLALGRISVYASKVITWRSSNLTVIDTKLKPFDATARAAVKKYLLTSFRFSSLKRILTTTQYFSMREEIIAAVDEKDRKKEIRYLVYDVRFGRIGGTTYITKRRRYDAAATYFTNKTKRTAVVSVPNLQILHALLKSRLSSRFNYDSRTATRRMKADRTKMESIAKKLKLITGKSP